MVDIPFREWIELFGVMCLIVPAGAFGLVLSAISLLVFCLDTVRAALTLVINGLMWIAVSKRIAAMEGACFGGLFCLVQYYGTATTFLVPALVAMSVGGLSGAGIYCLREFVEGRVGEPRLAY